MSATTTRTVPYVIAPELAAYVAHIDAHGLPFSLPGYDVFAAGYRACAADQKRNQDDTREAVRRQVGWPLSATDGIGY